MLCTKNVLFAGLLLFKRFLRIRFFSFSQLTVYNIRNYFLSCYFRNKHILLYTFIYINNEAKQQAHIHKTQESLIYTSEINYQADLRPRMFCLLVLRIQIAFNVCCGWNSTLRNSFTFILTYLHCTFSVSHLTSVACWEKMWIPAF